ncbi:MAG: hypothetical protein HQK51_19700 [Oligoflexia bacterium]|nr:hypothetical protein [Oligoflexia bacterium]
MAAFESALTPFPSDIDALYSVYPRPALVSILIILEVSSYFLYSIIPFSKINPVFFTVSVIRQKACSSPRISDTKSILGL